MSNVKINQKNSAFLRGRVQKDAFPPNYYLQNVALSTFIADDVFVGETAVPRVLTDFPVGNIYGDSFADVTRIDMNTKPPAGHVEYSTLAVTDRKFETGVFQGLVKIDDFDNSAFERVHAPASIQQMQAATRKMVLQIKAKHDKLIASKIFEPKVWDTAFVGVDAAPGAGQVYAFDSENSDPYHTVMSARSLFEQNTMRSPNVMICGINVLYALRTNAALKDRLKLVVATERDPARFVEIENRDLEILFKLRKIAVGKFSENTAPDGAQKVLMPVFDPNSFLLMYVPKVPTVYDDAAAYTFSFRLPKTGSHFAITNYPDAVRENHAHIVEGITSMGVEVCNASLGMFFSKMTSGGLVVQ